MLAASEISLSVSHTLNIPRNFFVSFFSEILLVAFSLFFVRTVKSYILTVSIVDLFL